MSKLPHLGYGTVLRSALRGLKEKTAPIAKPLSIMAFMISVIVAGYWFTHIPAPGKAIGLLGAVAVFMALRGEMHGSEKVMWIALVFVLLRIETRAIDKDRADNNVEQAKRRNEERNGFAEVLRQNEKHFLDMMADQNSKFLEALKASQTILAEERNLSKDTEARITGGNGFVRILPVNIPQDGDGLQLVATVTGEHVIRGVIFNVTEGRPPYSMPVSLSEFFTRKLPEGSFEGVLGDIPPHRSLAVGGVLHPKVGYFNINIYAFNGNFNEKLEVLLDHGSWRFCVIITRDADKVYQKKRVVNREGCNKDGTIMWSSQ